ncbi:class I SAM-dependent methyltransferase [Pseudorhodoplanes sp.]|uniref:class I SAM-dependent methyltransferase n=1 Tax=Pseudorhodoplanes sp. TaxID=1934341 RepID=UPI003D0FE69A
MEASNGTRPRHYAFYDFSTCNMCGADASGAKIMGLRLDKSQGRRPKRKMGIAVTVCKCRECGLVFANPQPVPASIQDHYGLPPESYWKSVSYEPSPGYFSRQVTAAKRLLGDRSSIKALDIGLGLGKAARVMRDAGFDVHGIEPSRPFFEKAVEQLGDNSGRFQLASIEEADFPPGTFDFVTFGAVLEHLYNPAKSIAKAMGWLRVGGIVHAEIPSTRHLASLIINTYYRALGTSYVTNTSPMHIPYHLFEFSIECFHKNGRRAGYEVAESWLEYYGLLNIPEFLHPPLKWWMDRTGRAQQLTVFLRKL